MQKHSELFSSCTKHANIFCNINAVRIKYIKPVPAFIFNNDTSRGQLAPLKATQCANWTSSVLQCVSLNSLQVHFVNEKSTYALANLKYAGARNVHRFFENLCIAYMIFYGNLLSKPEIFKSIFSKPFHIVIVLTHVQTCCAHLHAHISRQ